MPTENPIASALLWAGLVVGSVLGAVFVVYAPFKLSVALIGGSVAVFAARAAIRRYAGTVTLVATTVPIIAGVALISANGVRLTSNVTLSDGLLAAGAFGLLIACIRRPALIPPVPDWLWTGAGLLVASVLIVELLPPNMATMPITAQFLSASTGVDTGTNLLMGARVLVAIALVPIILASVCTTYDRFRLLTNAWLAGTVASCLIALVSAFTPFDLETILTGTQYAATGTLSRFTGLTVHPNHLGLAAVLALPVTLARLNRHWAYSPAAAILSAGVLLSGSRAALGAAIIAVAVVFILQPRVRRSLAITVAVVAIVGVAYSSSLSELTSIERLTGANVTSNTARAQALGESLELFYARPFIGSGFHTVRYAHNVPVQMLVAGGFLALIGYAVVMGGALLTARRLARSSTLPRDLRVTAAALAASLLVWLAVSLLQNNTIDRFVYAPVALVLGLWVAHRRELRRSALA